MSKSKPRMHVVPDAPKPPKERFRVALSELKRCFGKDVLRRFSVWELQNKLNTKLLVIVWDK